MAVCQEKGRGDKGFMARVRELKFKHGDTQFKIVPQKQGGNEDED